MIREALHIYSQNVRKNKTLTDIILETNKNNIDILFIQKPPRYITKHVPSPQNIEGTPVYGHPSHPEWTLYAQQPTQQDDIPRTITYINKRISSFLTLLRTDLIDHRDINLISLQINHKCSYAINVYSDDQQTAIKHLWDHEINIDNILIMAGDFNICDSNWDPSFPHHSTHTNDLMIIADNFDLDISTPIHPRPTRFANNPQDSNSVINLMFINPQNRGYNNHTIIEHHRFPSDHAPLLVKIQINAENTTILKRSIKPKSKNENKYDSYILTNVSSLRSDDLNTTDKVEKLTRDISNIFNTAWNHFSKERKITKHSKEWWDQECNNDLQTYCQARTIDNWKKFKQSVKSAKNKFFEEKITEIATTNKQPWDLMNWVKRKNLPATEAIKHNGEPCTDTHLLWQALDSAYNSTANRHINLSILNESPSHAPIEWPPFSKAEFREAIAKYNNSSAPGPDHVTWCTLKCIVNDKQCSTHIVRLANTCINLSTWPSHFKESTSVIIPKPQKPSYDTPKSFRPIVLLNTLGKLIEKVISHRMQVHTIANGYIHPNQLGGIQQRSTADVGIFLMHLIRAGWTKGLHTSILAFDIAQFFPSLNHSFLSACVSKAGFNHKVSSFFDNYSLNWQTKYCWNNNVLPFFPCSVGIGQGSALSPILSAIYLSPILKIFQKCLTNLKEKIPTDAERCKRGFSCYKQKVRRSGSSPQSRAKGSKGRMTERGDKND